MKAWIFVTAVVLSAPGIGYAQGKACEDVKSDIAQKLDAKGVKGYSLDIVDKDQDAGDGKEVGTCEHGSKKIVYHRRAEDTEKHEKDKP